jgi:uncharacterized protein
VKLRFEWDARKARLNLNKHKVSFEEAKTLFNDPFLVTFPEDFHSDHEERFISIGRSVRERILLLVHTEQREADYLTVRLISCRRATPSERRNYEAEK